MFGRHKVIDRETGAVSYHDKDGNDYKYPVRSCLRYLAGFIFRYDKLMLPLLLLAALCTSGIELIFGLFNKYIVDFALETDRRMQILTVLVSLLTVILIMTITESLITTRVTRTRYRKFLFRFTRQLYRKEMDTDYENLEKPQTKDMLEFAKYSVNQMGELVARMNEMIAFLFALAGWGAIASFLSPWLILIILMPTIVFYFITKYRIDWFGRHTKEWLSTDRKLDYIRQKSADYTCAKDIRLYHMEHWFTDLFHKFLEDRLFWYRKQSREEGLNGLLQLVVVTIRDIAAYGFIIWQMSNGEITPGDFILYFTAVGQISYTFYHIMDHIVSLGWLCVCISKYRQFLELPDASNRGKGRELPGKPFSIRFDEVCYRYGGAKEDTIHNLSFELRSGERIAIVGNNGAGKTTLVKLLCGIYHRTGGEIFMDGHSIDEYNRDELFEMYATVFQDIHIMPCSIEDNITMGNNDDPESLSYALEHSGLAEKLSRLPKHEKTMLVKSVYEEATDFSGGEQQKLALARALYKQRTNHSLVLLLDEPTAALDPLAEQRMYLEYARFTEGRSAVFISHRLASTRFCDRIFYLEGGKIQESGTHEELLQQNGAYAHAFQIQSQYYQKQKAGETAFGDSAVGEGGMGA